MQNNYHALPQVLFKDHWMNLKLLKERDRRTSMPSTGNSENLEMNPKRHLWVERRTIHQ